MMSAADFSGLSWSVLRVPQSDVRCACCKNGETSRLVVGRYGKMKVSVVGELVMLHAIIIIIIIIINEFD